MLRIGWLVVLGCASVWGQNASLTGEWEFTLLRFDGAARDYTRVNIDANGDKLSATASRGMKLEGALRGAALDFRAFDKDGKERGTLQGRLANDQLSGEGIFDEGKDRFTWT